MPPIVAYLRRIFKRKPKNKNKSKNKMRSTRNTTTTGGGHNPPASSSESYNRGETWRSWPPILLPSSSSEGEVEGQQARERPGQAGCFANDSHLSSQPIPTTIEAWWMDPALMVEDRHPLHQCGRSSGSPAAVAVIGRCCHHRRRVVRGEGAWWTEEQRDF